MKKHLPSLYKDTIFFDSLPPDAVLDAGDLATMRKSSHNTTPVPPPSLFGAVIHMDIVFGLMSPWVTSTMLCYSLIDTVE
jgi:hypothetical protein